MTRPEVEAMVGRIRAAAGDDEAAHALEDMLYAALLESIASGTCADPAACARAALKTDEIAFARWCA